MKNINKTLVTINSMDNTYAMSHFVGGQTSTLPGGGFHGGEQTSTLPGGGFHGGEQTSTLPGGGFHGGEQTSTLPGGGFHGGEQTSTLPGGGFHGGEQTSTLLKDGLHIDDPPPDNPSITMFGGDGKAYAFQDINSFNNEYEELLPNGAWI